MLSNRKLTSLVGLGALAVSVVVVVGVSGPGPGGPLPVASAAPSTSATESEAAVTGPFTADARGYVGTEAYCDESQTAAAYGRTARSLVVICADGDGGYEYRGVRTSDGASLVAAAEAGDGDFVAEGDDATYTVSTTALTVTSGGKVIYRDTWIEFQKPTYSAEDTAAPTTSSSESPSSESSSGESADSSSTSATVTATVTETKTVTATPRPSEWG
ncbi:hypothetical protein [Mycolicibacterium palauense]|uniref:hypothetical protein n=1 Tax=Mycolicibacterium palauense TaxID=2034511 RepID=UPI000BFEDE92|nr:hypothetical protein [Mycolicibacterium palauense]